MIFTGDAENIDLERFRVGAVFLLFAGPILVLLGLPGSAKGLQGMSARSSGSQSLTTSENAPSLSARVASRGADGTRSDYRRAERLLGWYMKEKVQRLVVEPHGTGGASVWYRLDQ
jgi:hypothetical protein